jgi:hypothetical protein
MAAEHMAEQLIRSSTSQAHKLPKARALHRLTILILMIDQQRIELSTCDAMLCCAVIDERVTLATAVAEQALAYLERRVSSRRERSEDARRASR